MWSSVSRILPLIIGAFLIAQPAQAREHSAGIHRAMHRHHVAWLRRSHRRVFMRSAQRSRFFRVSYRSYRGWHHHVLIATTSPGFVPFDGYQRQSMFAQPYRMPELRRERNAGGGLVAESTGQRSVLQSMAEQQASSNGVPMSLVDRVIRRESGYNPRAANRGNYGLMQIRLGTARAMGYGGSAEGLLDAATNLTYAVRYLAGAYRAAGGNENRAVSLYASGYHAVPVVEHRL